jgi:hypothetical protein
MNDDTAISGREVAKLGAGAPVAGIVPRTVEETFRLAELIHQSGCAPYQLKNAQAVAVVLLKGLEIGLMPMAALDCIGIINNKACLHSDGIPTLLWSRGFKIKEWYENEDNLDQCVAHCQITRPDGTPYEFKYSAKDAKENGLWDTREKVKRKVNGEWTEVRNDAPWFRFKKRMLRMRCRGWLARDVASDVLKGMPIFEEQADIELNRDEYKEVRSPEPKRVAAPTIQDIPDEPDKKPDIADTAADDDAPWHAALSVRELMEKLNADFAVASDMTSLNEQRDAYESAVEDRGLQQEAADAYEFNKKRIGAAAS